VKHIHLTAIRFDSTTQVRAEINDATVTDYAERMEAGDIFPPAELFEESGAYYIGDGWHRLLAAQKNGDVTIQANVQPGGRVAAVKCALGANATHGLKRTNADKRRSVEVALAEFGNLSDREIAKVCAVGAPLVGSMRPNCNPLTVETRLGADGKTRKMPAKQAAGEMVAPLSEHEQARLEHLESVISKCLGMKPAPAKEIVVTVEPTPCERAASKSGPYVMPPRGMFLARGAIAELEKIQPKDSELNEAMTTVINFCLAKKTTT
jgi:uncharacterized ParB-like nuclease family protein